MPREQWTPAYRRYQWRTGIAMAAYVVAIFSVAAIMRHPPASAIRYMLAVLPALCVTGVFVAVGRYLIEEKDEYQRYRMIVRILWATGGTLTVATFWGFLETFADAPHAPLYFAAIAWFLFLGIAQCVTRWSGR